MNKLEEICAHKRTEVCERKAVQSLAELEAKAREQSAPRGFQNALRANQETGFGLIAEIKKASPSKGLIRADFDPPAHAKAYAAGGAACLSVLTDAKYFQGHEDYMIAARAACDLPVLRKDFMVDPWQIVESRALGADAILIIVAALGDAQMVEIESAAIDHDLDVLVEVHDEREMERAHALKSRLIGINNRDLTRFVTSLEVTERLIPMAPDDALIVSESGISTHEDCQRLAKAGARSFLVGESLMRNDDVEQATKVLLNG